MKVFLFVVLFAVQTLAAQVQRYDFTSPSDQTHRTILYYIPDSVASLNAQVPAMVFLHGGGASTATDQTATDVALNDYMPLFTA